MTNPDNVPAVIPYLMGGERTATADDIEKVINTLQRDVVPDIRSIFDLLKLRVERLIEEDRLDLALSVRIELAGFAQAHRDILQRDPAPFFFEATSLALELDQVDRAIGLLEALGEEQRSGAMPIDWITETTRWITRLKVNQKGKPKSFSRYDELPDSEQVKDVGKDFTVVDVYYGTDRARTGLSYPSRFYGSERGGLELGLAQVTVPKTHRPGAVDSPSIFRLEFSENPVRHVVLRSIEPIEKEPFFERLKGDVKNRQLDQIFLFVHGFNVSFEEAMKRAAQVAYDMNYQGVPLVYSWPSRGRATAYIADTAVVRLSARRLADFIEDLAIHRPAHRINLIAHSMGSRAVADALELVHHRRFAKSEDTQVFDQLLFAAPDVDADLFGEMLPSFHAVSNRVTLYGSDSDWALCASRYLHGAAPRAGEGGKNMVVFDGLDSIDMSIAGEDMLAHSYFSSSNSALLDVATLFWRDADPGKRYGLISEKRASGNTWKFAPPEERVPSLLRLCSQLQSMNVNIAEEAMGLAREFNLSKTEEDDIAEFINRILS